MAKPIEEQVVNLILSQFDDVDAAILFLSIASGLSVIAIRHMILVIKHI